MGDDAVIVEGIDSDEARASLYSTVHGAGRLFGRKEAKRRFGREEMDAWLRRRGVVLIGADLHESPMAYRRLPEVLAEHSGTVKVLHTLRAIRGGDGRKRGVRSMEGLRRGAGRIRTAARLRIPRHRDLRKQDRAASRRTIQE
jgi:hypothetical protein